jgi:hypothetical protein
MRSQRSERKPAIALSDAAGLAQAPEVQRFGHPCMRSRLLAVAVSLACVAPAHALCIHNGELYAKTTVSSELAESPLVVKATVIDKRSMQPWGEDGEVGSLYTLRVDQTFKGKHATTIRYFTERNSGGFYLDKGETYLLFLTLDQRDVWRPHIDGAYSVNYSCGQSGPWDEVAVGDRVRLMKKEF